MISASGDQSIRFWDTSNWSETKVLRGHTDEIHSVAISPSGHFVASASKDGDLMVWRADGQNITGGYRRLPGDFGGDDIRALDQSRVLLLPTGKTAELVDLGGESPPVSMPEIGSSTNILGWFGTNILCEWNGTNQIILNEWRGTGFIQRGAMTLNSGTRPAGTAYNTRRQILAWTEATNSTSVYFANLAQPDSRVELRSDIPGLARFRFNKNGDYLVAKTKRGGSLRAWNIETRQIIASIDEPVWDAHFAADGRVLVVAIGRGSDHEIRFYDLARPDRAPRLVSGRYLHGSMAVSPDGALVASSTHGGLVRLFDPVKGELIETLHGHLNAVHGVDFSGDGRRLISTSGGTEAVKLWDVGTRQELLTLSGSGSILYAARWSADGDVILAGAPWQAWRAPSWEEIAAAEAMDTPAPGYGGQGKAGSKR